MVAALYIAVLALTVITLFYLVGMSTRINVYMLLVVLMVFLATLGDLGVIIAPDLQAAIYANDLVYLAGCFLPFFLFLLESTLMQLKLKKGVYHVLAVCTLFVVACAFSVGRCGVFYSSVELHKGQYGHFLVREYGPLHFTYTLLIMIYGAFAIAFMISSLKRRNDFSSRVVGTYVVIFLATFSVYIIEFMPRLSIILVPVVYVLLEAGMVLLARRAEMYDLSEDVTNVWEHLQEYAYIVVDAKKNYIGSNAPAKVLFPELSVQLIDSPIQETMAESPAFAECLSHIDAMVQGKEQLARGERLRGKAFQMDDRWLRAEVRPIYKGNLKNPLGYVLEFHDETNEKAYMRSLEEKNEKLLAAEADAREAAASKDRFLAAMSHEIRTPINTILGMNTLIERETGEQKIYGYSKKVDNAGHMLLSLVNDLLDFSKFQAGKLDLAESDYRTASIFADAIAMTEGRAKDKKLVYNVEFDQDMPAVLHGDDVRIRQILINILTNAIKYTKKGSVTLTANGIMDEDGTFELAFSVKDTGIGIREEDKAALFDSFTRLDAHETHHIEGTGLGLAITKQLVEAMHGTIDVDSVYGLGSVFTVRLPQTVVDASPAGSLEAAEAARAEAAKKTALFAPDAHILVVDDNASNLAVFTGLLKRSQINIDTAESGTDAVAQTTGKKYDCIFMDHMMPGMDGLAALSMIRNDQDNPNINTPAVALTANAVPGAAVMYQNAGFEGYLKKPVDPDELEAVLTNVLPAELVSQKTVEPAVRKFTEKPKAEAAAPGFNLSLAMKYCGGDENTFRNVLSKFIDGGYKYMKELPDLAKAGNFEDYRTIVHAIKSSSMAIGAEDLSKMAAEQEASAAAGDAAAVKGGLDALLKELERVVSYGRTMLDSGSSIFAVGEEGETKEETPVEYSGIQSPIREKKKISPLIKAVAHQPAEEEAAAERLADEPVRIINVSRPDYLDMAWEIQHLIETGQEYASMKKLEEFYNVRCERMPEEAIDRLHEAYQDIIDGKDEDAVTILKTILN